MTTVVPDWALDVLADPNTGVAVDATTVAAIPLDDGRGVIVDLSDSTETHIDAHSSQFSTYGDAVELLRPAQIRFRRLLKEWLARVPSGSVVIDIACAEMDFAHLATHLRYVPIDLSRERLAAGIGHRRSPFAVMGDITKPPIRPGAAQAILCTNTFNHLDDQQIELSLTRLFPALAAHGQMMLTVPARAQVLVERAAPAHGLRIAHATRIGGRVSKTWGRLAPRAGWTVTRPSIRAGGIDATREIARLDAWALSPLVSRRPPAPDSRDSALFTLVADR